MRHIMLIERNVAEMFGEEALRGVLVAVSGGADSVALLRLCHRLAKRLGLRVEAANCNFHLRGEESDRDSNFTKELCERLGITLHQLDYDVSNYMAEHPGVSTEMACRELRYADFFRIAEERGLDRIAVAHNADDDIETLMLNMLRGSGSRGLRGMDIYNGKIIRPLLGTTRAEIEQYLKEIGQDYITDSSNLTSDYRRNFLRREVIPMLEKRWPGARKSLRKTVEILKEESQIVENHYKEQLQRHTLEGGSLDVYANGVSKGEILRFLEPYGGNAEMAEEILAATKKQFSQRQWKLEGEKYAILERDRLEVAQTHEEEELAIEWEEMELTEELMAKIKSNRDHSKIYLPKGPEAYELRKPKEGDRMAPLGMRGTRLVSDIISDAKLAQAAKSQVRVLARKEDGEIIWVAGLKRSRHDLISPSPKGRVLVGELRIEN